jgi:hypothetical protein
VVHCCCCCVPSRGARVDRSEPAGSIHIHVFLIAKNSRYSSRYRLSFSLEVQDYMEDHDASRARPSASPTRCPPEGELASHVANSPFREAHLLRPRTRPDEVRNAVYVVPNFATQEECEALMTAANGALPKATAKAPGRYRLPTLCEALGRLSTIDDEPAGSVRSLDAVLIRRALELMESHDPALAASFFPRDHGLTDLSITFSPGEPAVNIYSVGGEFRPHTDKQHISLLVPLSPEGAFEGGGTAFWNASHLPPRRDAGAGSAVHDDDDDNHDSRGDWAGNDQSVIGDESPPSESERWLPHDFLLRPQAGTLIVFGGHVTHSALPVLRGTRHIFVASFSLWEEKKAPSSSTLRIDLLSDSGIPKLAISP